MTLQQWCRANWNKVHPDIRRECLDLLDGWIPKDVIVKWKVLPPYEVAGFHMFGGGMSIRNRLRERLTDMELPTVETNHEGESYRSKNWDDYYTGALEEWLERYNEAGVKK